MEDKREEILSKELLAYNNKDISGFCDCYKSDVVIEDLISKKTFAVGIDQVRKVYSDYFEKFKYVKCEVKSRVFTPDIVSVEEVIWGREDYPDGLHAIVLYEFKDGLISRVWFA